MQHNKEITLTIIQYLAAALLSLIIFAGITHVWHLHLSLPFSYTWDTILSATLVKTVIDTGWYTANPYIGAPGGYNLADFPINADNFNFLIIKFLSLFTNHYALVYNLFLILSVPAATLTSLFVLRRFGLRYPFALAASILFALQPYFFFRAGEGHLFLAAYYAVPLVTWLCILIAEGKLLPISGQYRYIQYVGYVLLCALLGSTGIYYALFGMFFIFITGIMTSLTQKKSAPFWQAALLCSLITFTLATNLAPSIAYRMTHGKNTEVAERTPFEAELYGLKIAQMLLPIDNDRIPILARLKNKYNTSAPLVAQENRYATLGLVASIGFVILLAVLILGTTVSRELSMLSKLNICGVLLATIGGFGSLISYSISPMVRCYARISIFIAFFSLFAFFYFAQKLSDRFPRRVKLLASWLLVITFLSIGVFSQTQSGFALWQDPGMVATINSDKQFVQDIEKIMPADTMIFQLPYVAFPEQSPIFTMLDYENFRVYLHSHDLKWSYGAIRGRPLAAWIAETSTLPTQEMVNRISYAGYHGIYIDRNGYADHGKDIENQISGILHIKPIVSPNNNLSFFDMRGYIAQLKQTETPSAWQQHAMQFALKSKVSFGWYKGFYQLENDANSNWRWCSNKGTLNIVNYDTKPLNVKISFSIVTTDPTPSTLVIDGSLIKETLQVTDTDTTFTKTIQIPPGAHKLAFQSNAAQLVAPGDARQLFFRIKDFKWDVINQE